MTDETTFFRLAAWAIRWGLLIEQERDTICRRGSRKQGYWARHLRDLRDIVSYRREHGQAKETA